MNSPGTIQMPRFWCIAPDLIDNVTGKPPVILMAASSSRDAARGFAQAVAQEYELFKHSDQIVMNVVVTDDQANDPVMFPVVVRLMPVAIALDPVNIDEKEVEAYAKRHSKKQT